MTKKPIKIKSFYYGFPVVIVSTIDPAGQNINISPLSASFCSGDKLFIATSVKNKTHDNIVAGSDVVVNMPDFSLWEKVEQPGRTIGCNVVQEGKLSQDVAHCADKFSLSCPF
ncbi:hypothetical protein [Citrobacter braakii]|uniref:hypothetical protein n=1 Tax=Citrobacter braakii TaxID=57706 RepID=UPI004039477A